MGQLFGKINVIALTSKHLYMQNYYIIFLSISVAFSF